MEVAPGEHDAALDAAFQYDLVTWDGVIVADDSATIMKNGPASTKVAMEKCTGDRHIGCARGWSRFGRRRSGTVCRHAGGDIPVCDRGGAGGADIYRDHIAHNIVCEDARVVMAAAAVASVGHCFRVATLNDRDKDINSEQCI